MVVASLVRLVEITGHGTQTKMILRMAVDQSMETNMVRCCCTVEARERRGEAEEEAGE